MNIFKHHRDEAEKLHRAFFGMHTDAVRLSEKLNSALRIIHAREENADTRAEARAYRDVVEGYRERAEQLLRELANFRTKLLGETGCDGSCTAQP